MPQGISNGGAGRPVGRHSGAHRRGRDRAVHRAGDSGTVPLRQIGERADVAPGTLRNHFPSREALDEAMVEHLLAEGPLPELSIYDGADTVEAQLAGSCNWHVIGPGRPALSHVAPPADADRPVGRGRRGVRPQVGSSSCGRRWGRWPTDRESMAVPAGRPPADILRGHPRQGTRSTDQVSDIVIAVITPWFGARSADRGGRSRADAGRIPASGVAHRQIEIAARCLHA